MHTERIFVVYKKFVDFMVQIRYTKINTQNSHSKPNNISLHHHTFLYRQYPFKAHVCSIALKFVANVNMMTPVPVDHVATLFKRRKNTVPASMIYALSICD